MSVMDTEVSTTTEGQNNNDAESNNGDEVTSSTTLLAEPDCEAEEDMPEVSSSEPHRAPFKMPLLIGPRPGKQKFLKTGAKPLPQCVELAVAVQELPEAGDASEDAAQPTSTASKPASTDLVVPYSEPPWSGVPDREYCFQIVKSGVILSSVDLDKPFLVVGRKDDCDIVMEHPSISRYHAVVQFRATAGENTSAGFYVYDLDSTHGTFVNKEKVRAKSYKRLKVGHMLRFGGSSRNFILEGPPDDQEEESPLTVTELKALRKKQEEDAKIREAEAKAKEEATAAKEQEAGVDWGMGEDAEDEDPSTENPFALLASNEDLYLDDPKKTLRGWFEREGYDMQYNVEEKGYSHFVCTIELPIDTANGMPVIAEASVKGKKKEAVVACALEACRILDQHGELRKSCHEGRKRKVKNWEENDFYDSDEDTFLDRTGTIEKKREMRMKMAKKEDEVDTYDTLVEKLKAVEAEISQVQGKLESSKQAAKEAEADAEDSLEAFMSSLKSRTLEDKSLRSKLRQQLATLLQDRIRLTKLANIAKPAHLPPLTSALLRTSLGKGDAAGAKKLLPMTGSMRGHPSHKKKPPVIAAQTTQPAVQVGQDAVEEEEEDEEETEDLLQKSEETKVEEESQASQGQDVTRSPVLDVTQETAGEDKPRVIGPARPPSTVLEFVKKDMQVSKGAVEKKKRKEARKACTERAEDYVGWLPPQGQSGDGKTHLNAKYGY